MREVQRKNVKCPHCGEVLYLDHSSNDYVCLNRKCKVKNYRYNAIPLEIKPNKIIYLGNINYDEYLSIVINTETGDCAFSITKKKKEGKWYGILDLEELQIDIKENNQEVYHSDFSVSEPAFIIDGSLNRISKTIYNYQISITTPSPEFTGFVVETTNANAVHDLVSTIENYKKRLGVKRGLNQRTSLSKEEQIKKFEILKELYQRGLISKEEYENKKKEYLDIL